MLEITLIKNQLYQEWQLQESARVDLLNNILDMIERHFLPYEYLGAVLKATAIACAEAQMLYEMACEAESDYEDYVLYWQMGE